MTSLFEPIFRCLIVAVCMIYKFILPEKTISSKIKSISSIFKIFTNRMEPPLLLHSKNGLRYRKQNCYAMQYFCAMPFLKFVYTHACMLLIFHLLLPLSKLPHQNIRTSICTIIFKCVGTDAPNTHYLPKRDSPRPLFNVGSY